MRNQRRATRHPRTTLRGKSQDNWNGQGQRGRNNPPPPKESRCLDRSTGNNILWDNRAERLWRGGWLFLVSALTDMKKSRLGEGDDDSNEQAHIGGAVDQSLVLA